MVQDFDWRRGYIANLGHGITPQAKVEAARRFVSAVHALGGAQ
jgi:uroporphyrinogen-III decarboxylase